ncbi:hypothetical protein [Sphingobium algorifonticola]|uniref:Uncharacterized protein n=1 Tax=Sphingobium algorifonticola TaxID=2008318 RepID=A0A437JBZ8_9SPHN|nr:hypothetical protein [Sphingobium algorifonticola]RVT43429.1 hypothetical protein ENE74_02025 [Sphingobium algorifonticola]
MRGILERGRAIGERAADRLRDRVADEARAVPGVTVSTEGDAIVIEGRALIDRWVEDARLRYVGRTGG